MQDVQIYSLCKPCKSIYCRTCSYSCVHLRALLHRKHCHVHEYLIALNQSIDGPVLHMYRYFDWRRHFGHFEQSCKQNGMFWLHGLMAISDLIILRHFKQWNAGGQIKMKHWIVLKSYAAMFEVSCGRTWSTYLRADLEDEGAADTKPSSCDRDRDCSFFTPNSAGMDCASANLSVICLKQGINWW